LEILKKFSVMKRAIEARSWNFRGLRAMGGIHRVRTHGPGTPAGALKVRSDPTTDRRRDAMAALTSTPGWIAPQPRATAADEPARTFCA
jgi:hypothetical protein